MGVGLFVLGTPIIRLLFPSLNVEVAGPLLSTLGIATPFVCMVLVCNSVLQAHGFINLPVIVMVLGGIVKIVNNYNLVGAIGIAGAPWATSSASAWPWCWTWWSSPGSSPTGPGCCHLRQTRHRLRHHGRGGLGGIRPAVPHPDR